MPASSQLVRRSGDLKGELVDFAQGRRFARTFQRALEQRFGGRVVTDEGEFINFLDWFVLQHRLPGGRTMVEEFVRRPELAEKERAMLLGWRDVVEGLFEVQRRDGEALVTVNLIDDGAAPVPWATTQGPCQRFARNSATRNLTPQHNSTLGSTSHLRGCAVTRGAARRRDPPAHRW